jgi:outer membrane protein OmpA-like peptidoglycan-associated protein
MDEPGGETRAGAGAGRATTRAGTQDAGGLNADDTTGGRQGGGAIDQTAGATRAGAGAGGATTIAGADGGGGVGDSEQLAMGTVGAPGSRAKVEEEVTAQTLGGMLPLVVGVDEEGQFDFDRAVLRPDVKVRLDELATKLDGAEYDRLDIIGYADRIGTEEYNQQLSERRAWAVARYLIDKGVPLKKMKVDGRGQRNSLIPEGACNGLSKAEMIVCVQKDRRVEIEASIRKTDVKVQ